MFFAKVSKRKKSGGNHDVHEDKNKIATIVDGIAGKEISDDNLVLPYTHELQELISSPQLEIFDAFLVLLSSFAVALSTLPADSFPVSSFVLLEYLENALGIYFFSAFFVRWYCVGQFGFSYLLRPLSFIDVFASVLPVILSNGDWILGLGYIPAVLSSPSALANLRLLRVLRLQALLVDMKTFSKVQIAFGLEPGDVKKYQLTLARVIITILCLVSVATGCIYAAEHEINPQIPDYFTALYFGLTTLTTVGFGDITPITTEGRFVVIASILVGVVVIPSQAAELVEALLDFQQERRQKKMIKNTLRSKGGDENMFETDLMVDSRISCPSCGRFIQSSRNHSIYIDFGLLMKAFLYAVHILGAAHHTAAFGCIPHSLCVSNCRREYHEAYRIQRSNNLYANNSEKDVSDKLVDEETSFFVALKSALQEVWMLKDDEETKQRISDLVKSILRRLANLSLLDYQWRSDYFKRSEADRRVEESLARMMGEEASYLRPMDAGDEKIGPMGRAEKKLVEWLSLVIEEEGRRARMISSSEGELVRPIELEGSGGGPLSRLESSAVNFIDSIRTSEEERAKTKTLRPKDLTEEKRGPLGNFEFKVVNALEVIRNSEKLRMEQSRNRGGEVVRPIDVPGPLGELELWYLELVTAEKQRSKDIQKISSGKLIRPKDGTIPGPMGKAEREFSEQLNLLKAEETERLKSFKKVLKENRPMEKDRNSPLGLIETILVGIIRGPQLIFRVLDRTKELLESEKLSEFDEKKSK